MIDTLQTDTSDSNYSLYVHIVPSKLSGYDNDKYYVGITSRSVEMRWQNGLGYRTQMFYRAIKKYGWDNIEHIVLCSNLTEKNAEFLEKETISYLKSNYPEYGYNIAAGGLTGGGGHQKVAQYDLSGKFIKSFPSIVDAVRELTQNKDVSCGSGIGWALSEPGRSWHGYMWRYYDSKPLQKIEPYVKYDCTVKVLQYDIYGNFVKRWNSLKEASEFYNTYCISNACRKLTPTAVGYQWKYETDDSEMTDISNKVLGKYIYVYTVEGSFIGEYSSISDAVRNLEIPVKRKSINLNTCYKDITKNFAHGYRWCEKFYESLPPLRKGKPVAQYDGDTDKIIEIFPNVPTAAKLSLDSTSSIYHSVKNNSITKNDYYWKYLNNIIDPVFKNELIEQKFISYTGSVA